MSLDPVIQAQLDGREVRVAHLVEFLFKTQTRRLWNGSYKLSANGHSWFGLRKLGQIDGLDDDGNLTAAEMKFSVSGVDSRFLAIVQLALAESKDEYVGRLVKVWLQFFDADWQMLGDPTARAAGIMDGVTVARNPVADGGWQRIITLTATNIFAGRGTPPASYYTDADQRQRSPGDRGLEEVAAMQETKILVPW